jgi:hypothetical protein
MALTVSLGCLGLLLLYLMVGGKWGRAVEPLLVQGAAMMPWVALLFLPLLAGLKDIYPWMHGVLTEGPAHGHQQIYFGVPFFIGRAVLYFACWIFLSRRAIAYVDRAHEIEDPLALRLGAVGTVVYFLTISFAGFDWIMSLEPKWSSSIYGAILLSGHGLAALAFMVFVVNWLANRYPERFKVSADAAQDLGNLILAFTLLWAYTNLSQFLIIWSGNLPEEIPWYLLRRGGAWFPFTTFLFVFQFGVTFALLLSRDRKRSTRTLATVAGLLLFLRLLDNFWLIVPDFAPKLAVHLLDVTTLLAVMGAWFAIYCTGLEKRVSL